MKKTIRNVLSVLICAALLLAAIVFPVSAATGGGDATYTVVAGDSMWKIAVRYEIGVSEIIAANPQVKNPNLIYPGQVLNIPSMDSSVLAYEQEVVRLVNAERAKQGLKPLTHNWELSAWRAYKSQRTCATGGYFSTPARPTVRATMIKNFGISTARRGEYSDGL